MPGSKEDFKRNNAFSLYNLYGHSLAQEPLPRPGVKKFTIWVDLSLVIITIFYLKHAPEYLRNISILHFLPPKLPLFWV